MPGEPDEGHHVERGAPEVHVHQDVDVRLAEGGPGDSGLFRGFRSCFGNQKEQRRGGRKVPWWQVKEKFCGAAAATPLASATSSQRSDLVAIAATRAAATATEGTSSRITGCGK